MASSLFREDPNHFSTGTQERAQVCPPARFPRTAPIWRHWLNRTWAWLWDLDEDVSITPNVSGLDRVKGDFNAALWDLQSFRAHQVRSSVDRARSLRELWHLRSELYDAVAAHRGQMVADDRVSALNAHFPVRISIGATSQRLGRTSSW